MHPYLWCFLYIINLLFGFAVGGAMILPLYIYDVTGEDLSKVLAIVLSIAFGILFERTFVYKVSVPCIDDSCTGRAHMNNLTPVTFSCKTCGKKRKLNISLGQRTYSRP